MTYLMATDWLIIVGAFALALHWRRHAPDLNLISRAHIATEIVTVFLYAVVQTGVFGSLHLYKRRIILSPAAHFFRTAQGVALGIAGYLLLEVITKSPIFVPSRFVIMNWALLQFGALMLHRLFLFPPLVRAASRMQLQRRIVIIGADKIAIQLANRLRSAAPHTTLNVIGFLCENREQGELITDGLHCLGKVSEIRELVGPHMIEGAIITNAGLSIQKLMDLIETCIQLFGWVDVHTDQSEVWHKNLGADTYFDIPFVRMGEVAQGPIIGYYKEFTDLVGSLTGILLAAPIMLCAAIAIKLTSPGPVLYVRERVGKRGKLFTFYKFRSMYVGADQDPDRLARIREHIESGDQRTGKVVNEDLITPVGRFIRKWAIDELPQLFNVLKGHMSLIGPRPLPPGEHDLTEEWQKKRYDIKPGCTGLWKVYAAKTGVSFDETALYDLYYARNMNPMLDLYILLMTVWVIITGRADDDSASMESAKISAIVSSSD